MPKAKLEFNLPEEQYDYECARRGVDFLRAITDIMKAIRSHRKYDMPLKEAFDEIVGIVKEINTEDIY